MCITFSMTLIGTSTSFAGDCKQVKFSFANNFKFPGSDLPVDIKIKKIAAIGNDGSWNENIGNKKISYGRSHTTNKRRLNKLDSGADGTFTVHFNHRKLGPGWQSATAGPFTIECNDNITIPFNISN